MTSWFPAKPPMARGHHWVGSHPLVLCSEQSLALFWYWCVAMSACSLGIESIIVESILVEESLSGVIVSVLFS